MNFHYSRINLFTLYKKWLFIQFIFSSLWDQWSCGAVTWLVRCLVWMVAGSWVYIAMKSRCYWCIFYQLTKTMWFRHTIKLNLWKYYSQSAYIIFLLEGFVINNEIEFEFYWCFSFLSTLSCYNYNRSFQT